MLHRLTLISNESGITESRNIPIFRSYQEMLDLLDYYVRSLLQSPWDVEFLLIGDGEFKVYFPSHKIFKHYRIVSA